MIEESTGENNGTYSCKAIYIMNGVEYPGELLSTHVSVEGLYRIFTIVNVISRSCVLGLTIVIYGRCVEGLKK